jgi:pimeloyl-ACP methyl ester carboxylesterase
MPTAPANGIEIWYETFGDPDDAPLLLVMGFTCQAIQWDVDFCNALVDRGYYVIRYDNRDVGLSTKIDSPNFDFIGSFMKALAGEEIDAPYLLTDMASDAVGLLDHLGIESAHVVGVSMGGMIGQTMAIEHAQRVRTLTSIMSTTGDLDVGQANAEAAATLLRTPAPDRETYLEGYVDMWRVLCGPVYFDEDYIRKRGAEAYDRCYFPVGYGRQLLGIYASGSRSEQLREVTTPTLVIHGSIDPLIDISGGRRTAQLVPEAELIEIDDMGHDLPRPLWPQIVDAIVRHTSNVERLAS